MLSALLHDLLINIRYPDLNFFAALRLDPIFHALHLKTEFLLGFQVVILLAGLLWLVREIGLTGVNAIRAALITWALFLVVVDDPFVLTACWFPALVAAFIRLERLDRIWEAFLIAAVIVEWSITAGALSVFGVLLAGVFAYSVSDSGNDRVYLVTVLLALLLSVILIPIYPMPDYPTGVLLTPLSPISFQPAALLGPSLNPDPLLYPALLRRTALFANRYFLTLMLIGAGLLFMDRGIIRRASTGFAILLLALLIVQLEGWAAAEDLRKYLPFQMIRRFVPGIGLAELPWLIIPFGLIIGLPLILKGASVSAHRGLVILTIGLLILARSNLPVINPLAATPGPEFFSNLTPTLAGSELNLRSSPSAYLLKLRGDWIAIPGIGDERDLSKLQRFIAGVDYEATVTASVLPEEAELAVDNRASSRWRTGRAQRPGDTFTLELDKPLGIIRLTLSIRENPADFPRGLRVETSLDGRNFERRFDEPNWLGPLKWTPGGYPYFGAQSEVTVDFPEPVIAKYFRFTQLGADEKYDWSIGEIKLFGLGRKDDEKKDTGEKST